jgi:hypothetical protein
MSTAAEGGNCWRWTCAQPRRRHREGAIQVIAKAQYNGRAAHRSRIGIDLASPSRRLGGWCILGAGMTSFFGACLGGEVQLSGEREGHIAGRIRIWSSNIESGLAPP